MITERYEIGNPQCYFLRSLWLDYGRHTETERVLVDNDRLTILNQLKIQSGPFGNTRELPFDGDKQ
jgi:hypothetical protein